MNIFNIISGVFIGSGLLATIYLPANETILNKSQDLIDKHSETINALIQCESQGKETAINKNDGKIGVDSINVLQFQYRTFRYYAEKYDLFSELDEADWMNRWNDSYSQKLVAATMIENETNWKSHWKICSKNL